MAPSGLVEAGDRSVTKDAVDRCRHIPSRLRHLASLRSEVPAWNDQTNRPATNVFVDGRVVIEIKPDRSVRFPSNVVVRGVLPPFVECAVVVRVEDLVV